MDLRESIHSQSGFSLELLKLVSLDEAKDSNFVFSPLTIHVVLSLIASGSSGKTLDQITSCLRSKKVDDLNALSAQLIDLILVDGSASGGPQLSFVNGVWVDKSYSLKAGFLNTVNSIYKTSPKPATFQEKANEVRGEVNSWAESETKGLIKELLPPGSVDATTRLILSNALYFKGTWTEKFDQSKTQDGTFHLLNGSSVQVPFMTSKKKQFVSAYEGVKVLRLPYQQGEDKRQFAMYILLPDERDGLHKLLEKLGSSGSEFLNQHLPIQSVQVGKFKLPRFKISYGFEVSGALKKLGLVLPFSDQAELSEMVDSSAGHNLSVSSVFHKSFIEVNEEGTEAAAASAAVIILRAMARPIDFVADHPFMFLIREDMTGVVLFVGHMFNPHLSG
ncbi:hypothetical protein AMTRI_Chr13g91230 [Amborella trichopoda]|uniref:Serpin domain-containing protein n=1 Tax=Amborella trichopoda TaxID=13333 RepID=W1PQN7_AMBTC|nr:serpin-ZXA [Amborella trichopoda]ERN10114.1 hypothetical protein AMTR_s00169p00021870 [Amborella trichopoda]|eukprot:XP_006848533.1 serpin-ZXA [Amborella trichopoda]